MRIYIHVQSAGRNGWPTLEGDGPSLNQALAYARVSTSAQAEEGVSLDAQLERIGAYCRAAGLDLVETIREEGVSGAMPLANRPGGRDVLRAVASHRGGHVIALKLGRLFRDAADALNQTRAWDKAGISLHLVDMGGQSLNTIPSTIHLIDG